MKKNRRIAKIDAVWLGKLHSLMKHGYTVAEAAEHMNVSEGAVTKYFRILRKIENRLPVEEKSNYSKRAVREYCQKQNLKLFEEAMDEDIEPDGDGEQLNGQMSDDNIELDAQIVVFKREEQRLMDAIRSYVWELIKLHNMPALRKNKKAPIA